MLLCHTTHLCDTAHVVMACLFPRLFLALFFAFVAFFAIQITWEKSHFSGHGLGG